MRLEFFKMARRAGVFVLAVLTAAAPALVAIGPAAASEASNRSAISTWYLHSGADTGQLGAQTSPITCGLKQNGCYAWFAGGIIYASDASAGSIDNRAILNKYASLGYENSYLGYPTMLATQGHGNPVNGAYVNFQGGSITVDGSGNVTVSRSQYNTGLTDSSGCSYAQGGDSSYRDTVCWIDMSKFDETAARSSAGQQMTLQIDGGYTATFTLRVSGNDGKNLGVYATGAPTYYAAGFGNTGFTSVKGAVNVVSPGSATPTTLRLEDIDVRDQNGNAVTQYGFVTADTESTEAGEIVTMRSDKKLNRIAALYDGTNRGCTSANTSSSDEGRTVTCVGQSGGSWSNITGPYWTFPRYATNKSGNIVYYATAPSYIEQVITAGTPNSAAFGFMVTKATTTVNAPSDAKATSGSPLFTGSVSNGSGSDDGGLRVPAGDSISTEPKVFLSGENLTFTANTFSGTAPSWYRTSWTCTVNGTIDTNLTRDADDTNTLVIRNSDIPIGSVVNCAASIQLRPTTFVLQQRHWGS